MLILPFLAVLCPIKSRAFITTYERTKGSKRDGKLMDPYLFICLKEKKSK